MRSEDQAANRLLCKALANGRCKFHGGLSTGPQTAASKARIAEANRQRAASRRPQGGRATVT
jgi:hypothetical protein